MYLRPVLLSTAALIVLAAGSDARGGGSIRTVALTTSQLPGIPDAGVRDFGFPHVDNHGRVAFHVKLSEGPGVDSSNDEGIWSEAALGDLRLAVRSGDQAPGADYRIDLELPFYNKSFLSSGEGDLSFKASLRPPSYNGRHNAGLFHFSHGRGLKLLASSSPTGNPAVPIVPAVGIFPVSVAGIDLNDAGDVVVEGGPVWVVDDEHTIGAVADGYNAAINDLGEVAYLTGRVANGDLALHVWSPSGSTRTLAAHGEIAPETAGALYRHGWLLDHDNAGGSTVFATRLMGPGATPESSCGVWAEAGPGEPLKLLMRSGDQAPGLGSGTAWRYLGEESDAQITFGRGGGFVQEFGFRWLDGHLYRVNRGVWAGAVEEGFHLVAKEGDPAPGTGPGAVFSEFVWSGVTRDGRGVMFALADVPGSTLRSAGIWAEGVDGELHLIVREGDAIELPSGEQVQLSAIRFDTEFGVSELGHIAFTATLPGGTKGLFVSDLAAVPEPCASVLAVMAFAAVGTGGERRTAGCAYH